MTDNATGIRAALARVSRLDQNGKLMTKTCAARHRDRYSTVHECVLGSEHGGYHRTVDGLMFYDEDQIRLRRVPVRAEQYLGKTGAIREIVEVELNEAKSGLEFAPCNVMLNGKLSTLWPGEWVVLFDDGHVERVSADRYREWYEEVRR
jgi:hypothetical protein